MPPSGFSRKAVKGSLVFIQSCYEDLLNDVRSGKFKTYEEAIQYELDQIEKALTSLHINTEGNLVERP